MKRVIWRPMQLAWMVCLIMPLLVKSAHATPVFARQYKLPCAMCHVYFPKLNDFGKAFKENNFRIPGQEAEAPIAFRDNVPISFQGKLTLTYDPVNADNTKMQFDELQLHAAGLLSSKTAFYVHHHLTEDGMPGNLYEGWVRHPIGSGHSYVKSGQYELPLAFSPEIFLLTHAGYLVYDTPVGMDDFGLGAPLVGAQIEGVLGSRAGYAVTVGNPVAMETEVEESALISHRFGDAFGRIYHSVGKSTLGAFLYVGRSVITDTISSTTFRDHFNRVGFDANAAVGPFSIYGLWLEGTHSDPTGTGEKGKLRGGFVGVDYLINPQTLGIVRYDRAKSSITGGDIVSRQSWTLSLQRRVTEDIRVMAEYQFRQGEDDLAVISTHFSF